MSNQQLLTYTFQPTEWRANLWIALDEEGSQTLVEWPDAPPPTGRLVIDLSNPTVAAPGSLFDPDGPLGAPGLGNHDPVPIDGADHPLHVATVLWVGDVPLPVLAMEPVQARPSYRHYLLPNDEPSVPGVTVASGGFDHPTGLLNTWAAGDWVLAQVPDGGSSGLLLAVALVVLAVMTKGMK